MWYNKKHKKCEWMITFQPEMRVLLPCPGLSPKQWSSVAAGNNTDTKVTTPHREQHSSEKPTSSACRLFSSAWLWASRHFLSISSTYSSWTTTNLCTQLMHRLLVDRGHTLPLSSSAIASERLTRLYRNKYTHTTEKTLMAMITSFSKTHPSNSAALDSAAWSSWECFCTLVSARSTSSSNIRIFLLAAKTSVSPWRNNHMHIVSHYQKLFFKMDTGTNGAK